MIQGERIVIIAQLIAVRVLKGSFIGKGIIQPTVLCLIILKAVQDIFLPYPEEGRNNLESQGCQYG